MARKNNNNTQTTFLERVREMEGSFKKISSMVTSLYNAILYHDIESKILKASRTEKYLASLIKLNYKGFIYGCLITYTESAISKYSFLSREYLAEILRKELIEKIEKETEEPVYGVLGNLLIIFSNEDIGEILKTIAQEYKENGIDFMRYKFVKTSIVEEDNMVSILSRLDFGFNSVKNNYTKDLCELMEIKSTLTS